jgi:hypothetical protein
VIDFPTLQVRLLYRFIFTVNIHVQFNLDPNVYYENRGRILNQSGAHLAAQVVVDLFVPGARALAQGLHLDHHLLVQADRGHGERLRHAVL